MLLVLTPTLLKANWVLENNQYYYIQGGQKATNTWKDTYYLKSDGVMAKNEWIFDYSKNSYYFLSNEGSYVSNKWLLWSNRYFYLKDDGKMAKSEWIGPYYLKEDGAMAKNEWIYDPSFKAYYFLDKHGSFVSKDWVLWGNRYFYLKADGKMAANEWVGDYYMKKDGAMAKNEWVYDSVNQAYYYLDNQGRYVKNQWLLLNDQYYYLKADGKMASREWKDVYYLKESGAMAKNEFIFDSKYNASFYLDAQGSYLRNTWLKLNNLEYYFLDNGIMVSNKWYNNLYFNKDGAVVRNNFIYDETKQGYLYLNGNGQPVIKDWVLVNNIYYYLNDKGIMLENEWLGSYYLKQGGAMAKSEIIFDGKQHYYIDAKGLYVKSKFITVGNNLYYFNDQGIMIKNEWMFNPIDVKHYYFGSNGIWDKSKIYNDTNEDRNTMKGYRLIDISEHNGFIDFEKLKGSIDGVIVRAGWDTNVDKMFYRNMQELAKYNIPYGFYWYSYALDEKDAQSEVNKFMEVIKPYNPTFPIYIDMEDADGWKIKQGSQYMANTWAGREILVKLHAEAYLKNGYKAGVYMSKSWFDKMSTDLQKYEGWVAHWDVGTEMYRNSWFGMHQYTDGGTLLGILGKVDLNIAWIYYPKVK